MSHIVKDYPALLYILLCLDAKTLLFKSMTAFINYVYIHPFFHRTQELGSQVVSHLGTHCGSSDLPLNAFQCVLWPHTWMYVKYSSLLKACALSSCIWSSSTHIYPVFMWNWRHPFSPLKNVWICCLIKSQHMLLSKQEKILLYTFWDSKSSWGSSVGQEKIMSFLPTGFCFNNLLVFL